MYSFSLVRIGLALSLTTYGLFGYGSEITVSEPFSPIVASLGLALSIVMGLWKSIPSLNVQVKGSDLRFIVSHFGVLAIMTSASYLVFGERELNLDELAFSRLTTTHAREVIMRWGAINGEWSSSDTAQFLSFLLVLAWLALSWVLAFQPRRLNRAFLLTGFFVFASQIVYSFLGGWGWGYAEVSWFPYLIAGSFFGFSAFSLKIFSALLVSFGLALLIFLLTRQGISLAISYTIAMVILFNAFTLANLGEIDHVVYGFILGCVAIPIILSKPSVDLLTKLVALLTLAVLFRITLIGILFFALTLLAVRLKSSKSSTRLVALNLLPFVVIIAPYIVGFVLFPAVLSSVSDLVPTSGNLTLLDFTGWNRFAQEFGLMFGAVFALALLLSLRNRVALLLGGFLVVYSLFVYFYALIAVSISTQTKYALEWQSWLLIFSLTVISLKTKGTNRAASHQMFLVAGLGSMALGTLSAVALQNLPRSPETRLTYFNQEIRTASWGLSEIQDFLAESNIGSCTPVGPLFGGTNELLAGRSVNAFRYAETTYWTLQKSQVNQFSDWLTLRPAVADASSTNCLYGRTSSFVGLELGSWKNWTLEHASSNNEDQMLVLLRK